MRGLLEKNRRKKSVNFLSLQREKVEEFPYFPSEGKSRCFTENFPREGKSTP